MGGEGGVPFTDTTYTVLKVLMGYRLDQPKGCPLEIYRIMLNTWQGVSEATMVM